MWMIISHTTRTVCYKCLIGMTGIGVIGGGFVVVLFGVFCLFEVFGLIVFMWFWCEVRVF